MKKFTYENVMNAKELNIYLEQGNEVLGVLGYTEHSRRHAAKVAVTAGKILKKLGYDEHTVELARIAGYMHDLGNCINRVDHAHTGALMAFQFLRHWGAPPEDIAVIITAIGQHDEGSGTAVDPVSAALILADKTDVRRNRVRNQVRETFDKHDQVNYAALSSKLKIDAAKKVVTLEIELDETICSMMDYFEMLPWPYQGYAAPGRSGAGGIFMSRLVQALSGRHIAWIHQDNSQYILFLNRKRLDFCGDLVYNDE